MFAVATAKPVVDSSPVIAAPSLTVYKRHRTRHLAIQQRIEDSNLAFVKQFKSSHDDRDMPGSFQTPRRTQAFSKEAVYEELFGATSLAATPSSERLQLESGLEVLDASSPRDRGNLALEPRDNFCRITEPRKAAVPRRPKRPMPGAKRDAQHRRGGRRCQRAEPTCPEVPDEEIDFAKFESIGLDTQPAQSEEDKAGG
jgi:hypothetical protein